MSKLSVLKMAILFACFVCGFTCLPLLAQGDRGVVTGRVTDPSGARVANAQVQIIDESAMVVLKTKSNSSGEYTFPSIIPGKYTIVVSAPGFEAYKAEHIQVDLGATKQIDIPLLIGSGDETVTVNAQSQQMDYDSADLGLVIEEKSMTDLPLVYGNAFSLENLTPGVTLSGVNPNVHVYDSGTSNVSINGSMYNSIDYKLDGAADNRIRSTAFTPNTESIAQYRLATSTYDASQGHASGGFTNVQVKSGTDQFHGSVFGYYQNPNLNANSWTLQYTPIQQKPTFIREGFTFGGPLYKKKLFFFSGLEKSYQKNPNNGSIGVPTQAEIGGDFSDLYGLDTSAASGTICTTPQAMTGSYNAFQIFDPRTNDRICVPHNNVALYLGGVDPVAKAVLTQYPKSNGFLGGAGDYVYAMANRDNYIGGVVRVDYALNPQQQVYMHLVRSSRFSQPAATLGPTSATWLKYNNYGAAVGYMDAISSTLVLTSVASFSRFTAYNYNPSERQVTPTSIGMPAYLVNSLPSSANALPRFDLGGYTSINTGSDYKDEDDIWLGSVMLGKQHGSHYLRTGFEYRLYTSGGMGGGTENGDYASDGTGALSSHSASCPSSDANCAGFSAAELEMGIISKGSQTQNSDYMTRSSYFATYLQDDWRATKQLSLNIGLRWEYETPAHEVNGKQIVAFDFDAVNSSTVPGEAAYQTAGIKGTLVGPVGASPTVCANPTACITMPSSILPIGGPIYANTMGHGLDAYSSPKWDFSPRIGFAFAVTPKTVIRGGFGLFYDSIQLYYLSSANSGSTTTVTIPQQGYSQTTNINAPVYGTSGAAGIVSTLDDPFPGGLTPVTGNTLGINEAQGNDIQFLTPHPHTPYNEKWNFGIQQQFGQFVITASYVGNHGVHTPTLQGSQGTNYGGRDYNATPDQYLSHVQGADDVEWNSGVLGANVTNPFYGITPTSGTSYDANTTTSVAQLLRPRPEYGRINAYTPDGEAVYHSLQIQVQRRFTKGLSTTQAFTWSKSMDATTFLNPGDANPWYGISTSDRPLRYSTSAIYELPWGHGRRWLPQSHGMVAQIVGGWQVQGVYQVQSGQPLNFGNYLYFGANPNDSHWSRARYKATIPSVPAGGTQLGGYWFNPANWLLRPNQADKIGTVAGGCDSYSAGTPSSWTCTGAEPSGNQLRVFPERFSGMRADHLNQADVGIQRQFQIRKYGTLQFRAEATNVLNHPVYSAPDTNPADSATTFARVTGQGNASRVFQFAGFFRF